MEIPQQNEKPLIASLNLGGQGAGINVGEVYFFEYEGGKIIEVQEKQAWALYMGRNGQKPKYIGCGTGEHFSRGIREAQQLFAEKGLKAAQDRIRQGRLEEIEKARGNLKRPRNFDRVDIYGNPTNV